MSTCTLPSSGASTTYTLFQMNQSWFFRPISCSGGIQYSPWIASSDPEPSRGFHHFHSNVLGGSFPLNLGMSMHSRSGLCPKKTCSWPWWTYTSSFSCACSNWWPVFHTLSSFSCELPPGGPPSPSLGGVFIFPLRPGGCLSLGWPVLCCCKESWWVPSSWGSWLLLSSYHGSDHLGGGVGSPAAVDSHAGGFCDGFTWTQRMNLLVIPGVPTLPKSYFTTLESVKCSKHELSRHPILICSWFWMLLLK